MAYAVTRTQFPDIARPFRAVFSGISWFFVALAEAQAINADLRTYQSMSDERLGQLGLRREDIVGYVFNKHHAAH